MQGMRCQAEEGERRERGGGVERGGVGGRGGGEDRGEAMRVTGVRITLTMTFQKGGAKGHS